MATHNRTEIKMPLAARQRPVGVRPEPEPVSAEETQAFDWAGCDCTLYLQSSLSFLSCAVAARTALPLQYPCVSVTSMGVTLVFEVPPRDEQHAHASACQAARPGVRVCDVAVLGIHLGHPRFAAMRKATLVQPLVRRRESYAAFIPALTQAIHGELDADQAHALVVGIIDHALKLAGCQQVRLDERVEAAIIFSDREQRCPLREVAAAIGISPSRLSHLFSEQIGMSFRQYAVWCRTMQSWDLVMFSPEKSLTEVAYEMEFADLAHFSRAFKTVFGVTPSGLRERTNVRVVGRLAERGRRAVPWHEWPV